MVTIRRFCHMSMQFVINVTIGIGFACGYQL
jgi:hypothetical protein